MNTSPSAPKSSSSAHRPPRPPPARAGPAARSRRRWRGRRSAGRTFHRHRHRIPAVSARQHHQPVRRAQHREIEHHRRRADRQQVGEDGVLVRHEGGDHDRSEEQRGEAADQRLAARGETGALWRSAMPARMGRVVTTSTLPIRRPTSRLGELDDACAPLRGPARPEHALAQPRRAPA